MRAIDPVDGGRGSLSRPEIFTDRRVYSPVDRFVHGLVQASSASVVVVVRLEGEEVSRTLVELNPAIEPSGPLETESGAVEWWLPLAELAAGEYELEVDGGRAVRFTVGERSVSGDAQHAEEPSGPLEIPVQIVDPTDSLLPSGPASGLQSQWPRRWGLRTAIALPEGAVTDPERLVLLSPRGEVPAQFEVLSWWSSDCSSVRWVALDFVAERSERVLGAGVEGWSGYTVSQRAAASDRSETETLAPDLSLRLDPEAWGVPFVVDRSGRRYRPRSEDGWVSEVEGEVRASFRREGWFTDPNGQRHSRYSTRVTRFGAGADGGPVSIEHRVVVTPETLVLGLRDAGWEVPTSAQETDLSWRSALDGGGIQGEGSVFLHQDRPERCRVVGGTEERTGQTCDGWLAVADPARTGELVVSLPKMSEHFPKELEWTGDHLVVHFWPRHGRRAFSEREELSRSEIHQARFAHQGETLEWALPEDYAAALRRLHTEPGEDRGWDAEGALDRAVSNSGSSVGLAFGGDFHLMMHPSGLSSGELASFHAVASDPPHALQDPETLATSRAEGDWLAAPSSPGEVAFPATEQALARALPEYRRFLRSSKLDYGFWIYPGVHNAWDPKRRVPILHRVWQASHYRNVSGAWLLYLRSADPQLLSWARETSRQFRDVHVLHHPTEHDPIGAMDHCKGLLPWAARSSIWGHWIDADALRLRHLLLGDAVSEELYRSWAGSLIDSRMHLGADREGVTTLGELLAYYRMTFDPRALVSISEWGESVLSKPFEEYREPATFPAWHRDWMARYFELTRDPRVLDRASAWLDAGFEDPAATAFVARLRPKTPGSTARLRKSLGRLHDRSRQLFIDEGDPQGGFSLAFANPGSRFLYSAPNLLAAADDAGLEETDGVAPVVYPSAATHSVARGADRGAGLEVWLLDSADESVGLLLDFPQGYGDLGPISYRVLSPTGRVVAQDTVRLDRDGPVALELPPDGESGVYRIQCRGYRCALRAPLSDLPEVAVAAANASYRGVGRMDFRLTTLDSGLAEVELGATLGVTPAFPQTATPAWVEVRQDGAPTKDEEVAVRELLWESTLFAYSARSSERFTLEPRAADAASFPVWALRSASRFGPSIEVTSESPGLAFWVPGQRDSEAERVLGAARAAGLQVFQPNVPIGVSAP